MRESSPGPADMRKASSAEKATTARKSSVTAPGTCAGIQVRPALVVRRYVPCVPLAQAIWRETAPTPRRVSLVCEVCARGRDWAARIAVRSRSQAERIGGIVAEIERRRLVCRREPQYNLEKA